MTGLKDPAAIRATDFPISLELCKYLNEMERQRREDGTIFAVVLYKFATIEMRVRDRSLHVLHECHGKKGDGRRKGEGRWEGKE